MKPSKAKNPSRSPASKAKSAARSKDTIDMHHLKPKRSLPVGKSVKVVDLRGQLGFSQSELSRITGYSVSAIAAWEAGKPLSEAAKLKINETERLQKALCEILPANQLSDWMRSPNPAFEGQTPIQVIERGESDRIWQMIFQIDDNVAN